MALHGRTKIELTDVHTGRVDTIEKSNFITAGVAEYNRPLGGLTDSYGLLYGAHIADYFGGVCLFDKPLEGDENTIFPQGGAAQVGAAEYGVTNTTADTWLGSYNTNESNIDYKAHTATFVYDFGTAQANGNIAAVALAPKGCGTGGAWGVRGGTAYPMVELTHTGSNDFAPHTVAVNAMTAQYDATTNRIWPVLWDLENDVGYYLNVTGTPYRLEKRKLYLKTASLFYDQATTNTTILEEWELDFGVACSFYATGYDQYDATHFCVYGYTETSGTADAYAGKVYCFVVGFDGTLYKTITAESPCKKTRVADLSVAYLKGYVLVAGNATEADGTVPIYRVPEGNPTDIQAAEVGQTAANMPRYFKFPLGEMYFLYDKYTANGKTYRALAYNVANNRLAYTNARFSHLNYADSLTDEKLRQIPVLGYPLCFLHYNYSSYKTVVTDGCLYRVRMFLSTINNLDEPVTKTADKTMKITYTITEVAEGGENT